VFNNLIVFNKGTSHGEETPEEARQEGLQVMQVDEFEAATLLRDLALRVAGHTLPHPVNIVKVVARMAELAAFIASCEQERARNDDRPSIGGFDPVGTR